MLVIEFVSLLVNNIRLTYFVDDGCVFTQQATKGLPIAGLRHYDRKHKSIEDKRAEKYLFPLDWDY